MTSSSTELVEKIFSILIENQQTLCVAESCTGGLISNTLTNTQGASDVFKGAVISYTNASKINALQVSKEFLKSQGSVNSEVALSMALGVKSLLKADWSLSITGYMDTGTEPGRVFIGVVGPQVQDVTTNKVQGSSRVDLKYQSLLLSLSFLLSKMDYLNS